MYKSPESRMTAARTRLLLDFPWFGSLAMRLRVAPDASIKTLQTDGTSLTYNPKFIETLTDAELTGVVGHEVYHCALLHPYRRGNRDAREWNEACDYATNGELIKAGLKLPKDALIDPQYDGLSVDVIYARRHKEKQQQPPPPKPQPKQGKQPGQGQGQGDPTPGEGQGEPDEPSTGKVVDAPQPGTAQPDQPEPMTATDWKVAAEQASAVAKGCGKLPGSAAAQVKAARTIAQDWRVILREFVEHTVPSDYSWTSPNRRHVANGLYLPGIVKENLGHVAIAVDTSGSISAKLLAEFCAEINAITQEARAEKVTVLYCDSTVQKTEEFAQDDEIVLNKLGGGGTAFQPVFDAVSAWDEPPVCLIYCTDLDNYDEIREPEFPVLWVTDESVTKTGEFGQTVRMAE